MPDSEYDVLQPVIEAGRAIAGDDITEMEERSKKSFPVKMHSFTPSGAPYDAARAYADAFYAPETQRALDVTAKSVAATKEAGAAAGEAQKERDRRSLELHLRDRGYQPDLAHRESLNVVAAGPASPDWDLMLAARKKYPNPPMGVTPAPLSGTARFRVGDMSNAEDVRNAETNRAELDAAIREHVANYERARTNVAAEHLRQLYNQPERPGIHPAHPAALAAQILMTPSAQHALTAHPAAVPTHLRPPMQPFNVGNQSTKETP